MALVNPSDLYRGSAVVLDSTPSLRFATELMMKQQAKMDALNQYYAKTQQNLAEKELKMRPQDVSDPENPNRGWGQQFNEMQENYLKNRQAIIRPRSPQDYQAKAQYDQQYNQLMGDAAKSVNLQNTMNETRNKILYNKNYVPTDNDMNVLHTYEMSMYNPKRTIQRPDPITGVMTDKEPDLNGDLSLGLPPLDGKSIEDLNKAYTQGIKINSAPDLKNITHDPKTGEVVVPYNSSFSTKQMQQAADRVPETLSPYTKEGAGYEKMLTDLHKDPISPQLQKYNQAYQNVYGAKNSDGSDNIIDTPAKLEKANVILNMQSQGGTQSKYMKDLNDEERMAVQKMIEQSKLTEGRQQRMYDYKQKGGKAGDVANNDILDFYNKNYAQNEQVPSFGSNPFGTQNAKYIDLSKIDPEHYNIITNKGSVKPMDLGNGVKAFQVDDKTGDWIGAGGQRIDRQAAETAYKKWKTKSNLGDTIGSEKPATETKPETNTITTSKGIKVPVFK